VQATGKQEGLAVARDTIAFLDREMTAPLRDVHLGLLE
jgi:hypothetical protein